MEFYFTLGHVTRIVCWRNNSQQIPNSIYLEITGLNQEVYLIHLRQILEVRCRGRKFHSFLELHIAVVSTM